MWPQSPYQSLAHVPKQMPMVGDLHGLWRGFGSCFGMQAGAIAADDSAYGCTRSHCSVLSAPRPGNRSTIIGIRTGEQLHSPVAEINITIASLQLANISWMVDGELGLDTNTGHVMNNPEAMKPWSRQYEKGWEITVQEGKRRYWLVSQSKALS
jgi:hypothetical protein